ncbi:peptidoglycan-recognition protein LB [Zeugodacus cucurbitae]|uniref:Peptidoglycan-recognition protein LB n=1 Tax=Zeugodacus cucurbitae TaxID=28588 RepID=A0A0A1XMG1_ZEUCU|nr:peptidoglycan-recognition protein LB [Zeugodacus cucurbitae]
MVNAAGSVGNTTAAQKLILLVNLLLFGAGNMFTSIELREAAAIPDHNDTAATGDQILGYTRNWRLITRAEWGARTPTSVANFTGPAPYVILHHSYQPGVCRTEDACKASMRSMQNFHMNSHGWPDIGYSFAVGGDGNVYEGRGYDVVGAHAPNYNSRSIGLLLIGNFMEELPPAPMLQVAQDFIKYSMEEGHLRDDYILHGHRQVRNTECPGDALYAVIKKWPHWQDLN